MEQGAEKILAKHGYLYMKDDYKALFEELEAYYNPTEAVKNNAVLPFVSTRTYDEEFDEVDCEHYEYEIGFEDNDEICHLGIGIDNCSHCFKNKKLYVC